jgi:hypothetical protein
MSDNSDIEDNEPLLKPKASKKKKEPEPQQVIEQQVIKVAKPKRIMSEKQKEQFEKAREKRKENIEKKKLEKKIEASKLLLEQGIIKNEPEQVAKPIKKSKQKLEPVEEENESSSEEEIIIKKVKKPKKRRVIKIEESDESEDSEPEERPPEKPKHENTFKKQQYQKPKSVIKFNDSQPKYYFAD